MYLFEEPGHDGLDGCVRGASQLRQDRLAAHKGRLQALEPLAKRDVIGPFFYAQGAAYVLSSALVRARLSTFRPTVISPLA